MVLLMLIESSLTRLMMTYMKAGSIQDVNIENVDDSVNLVFFQVLSGEVDAAFWLYFVVILV